MPLKKNYEGFNEALLTHLMLLVFSIPPENTKPEVLRHFFRICRKTSGMKCLKLFCGIVKWLKRFFNPDLFCCIGTGDKWSKDCIGPIYFSKIFMKTTEIWAFVLCMLHCNLVSLRCNKYMNWFYDLLFYSWFCKLSSQYYALPMHVPAGNYMFKVNNRNTRAMCEIC